MGQIQLSQNSSVVAFLRTVMQVWATYKREYLKQ
jgi:hypothetical protein